MRYSQIFTELKATVEEFKNDIQKMRLFFKDRDLIPYVLTLDEYTKKLNPELFKMSDTESSDALDDKLRELNSYFIKYKLILERLPKGKDINNVLESVDEALTKLSQFQNENQINLNE